MKNNNIIILLSVIFILAISNFIPRAYAEEIDSPVECNGDNIEYFEEERKVVGSGNILIKYKDTVLTCDRVTVWVDKKEADAEGNVNVVQGEDSFGGERIIYNFENETGKVVSFTGYTDPWYTKGKSAERTGPDEFIVKNGYVTTCSHKNPHYRISGSKVLIYPDVKVVLRNAIVWAGPVPILWIPVYAHPLDDDRPHVTVVPGKNDDWGAFALTAWRYDLDPNHKGFVHLDYRERKDFAWGIDHTYGTDIVGRGTFRTYYMRERDLQRDHVYKYDEKDKPTVEAEKFLVQLRHEWQISDDTKLIGELYKYRDKDFRKDYFDNKYNNEYEQDESPDSYLLITKTQPVYTFSALTEKRANRFEDVTERLPELKLDIYNSRIGQTPLYYTGELSAVSLNKKYPRSTDEDPVGDIPIHHNNRYDSYSKLSYATKASFLNITPFAGMRQTYYDRSRYDDNFKEDSHVKGVFYTGTDISTKFYKVFPITSSFLGVEINNLRHIITPSMSYDYNTPPTMANEKLFGFDSIDTIDRTNSISFGVENKLQTKRGPNKDQSVDIARLGISTSYDLTQQSAGRRLEDYVAKLELNPHEWLSMSSTATIDSHKRYHHKWLKEVNTDISFSPGDWLKLGMSHGYTNGDTNNIIGQLNWQIFKGLNVDVFESFDIKRLRYGSKKMHDLREQRYIITKDLHCWEIGLHYNVFRDKGEEMLVVFKLKAFPDMPFSFGRNYHEPKKGSQDYSVLK